jgi:hypothetical protein
MTNINELIKQKEFELRQKELAVQQLLKELEALRLAARLITEAQTAAAGPRLAVPARAPAPSPPASPRPGGYGAVSGVPRQFP